MSLQETTAAFVDLTEVSASVESKPASFSEYAKIPRMNPSTLVHGLRSMKRLKRMIDCGGVTKTDAMILGSGVHCLILEPEEFEKRFCVMPDFKSHPENVTAAGKPSKSATEWSRGKEAEFIAANPDKEILTDSQYATALKMIAAIRSNPAAAMWIDASRKEVTVTGEICGVEMKGRMDLLGPGAILDVKTTNNASPFAFGRTFTNLHYGFRMCIYRELVRQNYYGRNYAVYMIAQEDRDDFDTVVYEVPEVVLDNAMPQVERVLNQYKACCESGIWPGIDGGESYVQLVVPQWAMSDELDWSEA